MITILMPCHELNQRLPDDNYKEEYEAAKLHGFRIVLFDYDKFVRDAELILKDHNPGEIDVSTDVTFVGPMIYRGYMLNENQYQLLYNWIKPRYTLINTPEEYIRCHHFPEVYEYFKEHTAKSVWFTDPEQSYSLIKEFSEEVILKDFVKSIKDSKNISKIPVNINPKELLGILEKFRLARGKLFTKGFVFKQALKLKQYNGKTNEWRCVFFNKKLVSATQNSNLKNASRPNIAWLFPIAAKIPSNFFTLDVMELEDGSYSIIEAGDGQVSGPTPGQNMLEYYAKLREYTTVEA